MFLVGGGLEEKRIHTEALARQSLALHTLVHGPMEESRTKIFKWPDVDEGTFGRFAQFIYTGNYPPPSPVGLKKKAPGLVLTETERSSVDAPVPEAEISYFGFSVAPVEPVEPLPAVDYTDEDYESYRFNYSGKKSKKGKKSEPEPAEKKNEFSNLKYIAPSSNRYEELCRIPSKQDQGEDYTTVFLGHAQLYMLADKWFIAPLKNLVLKKLHTTLSKFVPFEARYGDIAQLVRYTYDNTPCRKGGMDALRELVIKYVAYEVPKMLYSRCGSDLLEEIGPFARDITPMIMRRAGI